MNRMRLPMGGLFLLAALLLGRCWLEPISAAAPLAANCSPRPPVSVSVALVVDGTLQATIGAATSAGVTLEQLTFGTITNALIDIPGRPPRDPNPAPVNVSGQGSTSFNFHPAAGGQPVTIPLTVVDSCGAWPTFVGGGPTAFSVPVPTPTTPPGPTATAGPSPTSVPSATPSPVPSPTATPGKAGAIVTANLGASQQVVGGQVITVYWSGLTSLGAKDQIGLYRTGDTAPQNNRLQTPLFTGGQASGNANITITNDALLPGTESDTFEFILFHEDATTPTPSYVTQSQPFTVVTNTVSAGPAKPPAPPPPGPYAPGKSAGAGAKGGPAAPDGAGAKAKGGRPPSAPTVAAPALSSLPGDTPVSGNDNFASAFTIGALPGSFTEPTATTTTEPGEPTTCSGAPLGKTVWYRVVPGAVTLTLDTYGSNFDTVLAVYTGGAVNALSLVACNDESASTHQSQVTFAASGGTTYFVQVGGYGAGATAAAGNLVLHVNRGAPANDNFAAAIPVAVPTQVKAITDSATSEPGEATFVACPDIETNVACPIAQVGIGHTVWYRLTPGTTTVTIDTVGSSFDTVLAVYTGGPLTALTLLTYDDDGAGGHQSRVSFPTTAGITYYVQAGGFAVANGTGGGSLSFAAAGDLTVNFSLTVAPPNNGFAQAIPLSIPAHVTADTTLATTEAGEPTSLSCIDDNPGIGKTVWYTFSPASGTVVTLDTFGSNFDTVVAVYTGNAVGSLTLQTCDDDSGGIRVSEDSFVADGSLLHIQVGGFTDGSSPIQSGNLVLNVGFTPNDNFAAAYEAGGIPQGKDAHFLQVTDSATTEPGEPTTCNGIPLGKTVWYRFTPQVPGTVSVDTFDSNYDTVLGAYTSSSGTLGGLSAPLACNRDPAGMGHSQVAFPVAAGTTYYVQAGGFGSGAGAASGFLGSAFTFLAPANDNRANAIDVSAFPSLFSEATLGATTEAGEPTSVSCNSRPIGRTVWYKLSNSQNATVTITTQFSNFDTLIAAYRQDPGGLTEVGCNDDAFGTLQSLLSLSMTANTQYYVQISGTQQFFGGDFGNLYVNFLTQPPPNDNFAQALVVPGAGAQTRRVFTGTATTEPGEPTGPVCGGVTRPTGKTVWYSYTPGARPVTLSTFGSDFDTVLAVYTGNAVGSLSLVTCNDDAGGTSQSQVSFTASAGITYFVQVGGYGGSAGTAVVNFQ